MSFNNTLTTLRKIGRNAVLPVEKIKNIVRDLLSEKDINNVLDFGAGTMFWSNWFVSEFAAKVCAVDTYYDKNHAASAGEGGGSNIICYSDLSTCILENKNFSLVWACDVLHHLQPAEHENFFNTICDKTNVVIIKDIDATHKFGNFMNRMHDQIINGEQIHDIYPDKIKAFFEARGFDIVYHYLPKIWYPHFVSFAVRQG